MSVYDVTLGRTVKHTERGISGPSPEFAAEEAAFSFFYNKNNNSWDGFIEAATVINVVTGEVFKFEVEIRIRVTARVMPVRSQNIVAP